MNEIKTIGGCLDMNARYQIRGGKVCYNYRRPNNGKMKALRKDETYKALVKYNFRFDFAVVLIWLFIGFLGVAVTFFAVDVYKNIEQYIEVDKKQQEAEVVKLTDIEHQVHIKKIYGSKNVIPVNIVMNPNNKIENKYITTLNIDNYSLQEMELPNQYYSNLDYSTFSAYMGYHMITDKSSPSYKVTYSENCYTDENGFRRYKISDDQFSINGVDDYVVALGTYYKEAGTAGQRYLVETTKGKFTIIAGGEKDDKDTDDYNMFGYHHNGKYAGIIEYIVDVDHLNRDISLYGNVNKGPVEVMKGEILHIYKIKES